MSFRIEIEAATAAEAFTQLRDAYTAFAGQHVGSGASQAAKPEAAPAKATTGKSKPAPAPAPTTSAASTPATPPSSETPGPAGSDASTSTSQPASTPGPTLDEVRAALQPLLRDEKLGSEVSKLVVAQGATKLSLVDPSKYAALLESAAPFLAQLAGAAK